MEWVENGVAEFGKADALLSLVVFLYEGDVADAVLDGAVPAGDGVGGFFSAADGCLEGAHGAPYALG